MQKIGFIGLGIMGKPMSRNLVKKGYDVTGFDIFPDNVKAVAADGVKGASSAKDACSGADVVVLMLPDSPQVKEVVLGNDGIVNHVGSGKIIVDMSSIAPLVSKEVAEKCAEKGIRFIDAPVSGGEPKAIDGSLSIMCGGEQKDFDEVKDILLSMGASAVLTGPVGSGNTTKLANQIIVALNIAAVSEALVLGQKAGVNPEAIYNAIRGGLAGSTVFDAKAPMMMERNFNPGFKIDLHIKDLKNVLETSHGLNVSLPLTAGVMEIMQACKMDGKGQNDHSALVTYYEKLAKIEVKK